MKVLLINNNNTVLTQKLCGSDNDMKAGIVRQSPARSVCLGLLDIQYKDPLPPYSTTSQPFLLVRSQRPNIGSCLFNGDCSNRAQGFRLRGLSPREPAYTHRTAANCEHKRRCSCQQGHASVQPQAHRRWCSSSQRRHYHRTHTNSCQTTPISTILISLSRTTRTKPTPILHSQRTTTNIPIPRTTRKHRRMAVASRRLQRHPRI